MKKLKIAAIASGILTVLQLAPSLMSNAVGVIFGLRKAAAIGVIGSADGPTSVFVAHLLPPFIVAAKYIFFAACALTFVVSMVLIIKNRRKNGE